MSEKELMNSILESLEWSYPGSFDRINNIPSFNHVTKRFQRLNKYQRKGTPDIIGCLYGRWIAIEVKTSIAYKRVLKVIDKIKNNLPTSQTDKHLIEQINYMKLKEENGGICFFTFSVDHTLEKLRSINGDTKKET